MVLGGASQKISTIVELAEELYEKVTELREQLAATRETLDGVDDRVRGLEREADEQRAILEAVAAAQGIDVDDVLSDLDGDGESGEGVGDELFE